MSEEHPARAAARRSMDAVQRGDRRAWLDNFAADAVVEDPIGPSPFDPEGRGHRGKEAIGAFWDAQIAPNRVMVNVRCSYAAGSEVANVGTVTVVAENGAVMLVDGVFTYRVNEAGKVVALRAYWELDGLKVLAPAQP
jgi:ketosteroid isomerase-like protein